MELRTKFQPAGYLIEASHGTSAMEIKDILSNLTLSSSPTMLMSEDKWAGGTQERQRSIFDLMGVWKNAVL